MTKYGVKFYYLPIHIKLFIKLLLKLQKFNQKSITTKKKTQFFGWMPIKQQNTIMWSITINHKGFSFLHKKKKIIIKSHKKKKTAVFLFCFQSSHSSSFDREKLVKGNFHNNHSGTHKFIFFFCKIYTKRNNTWSFPLTKD